MTQNLSFTERRIYEIHPLHNSSPEKLETRVKKMIRELKNEYRGEAYMISSNEVEEKVKGR